MIRLYNNRSCNNNNNNHHHHHRTGSSCSCSIINQNKKKHYKLFLFCCFSIISSNSMPSLQVLSLFRQRQQQQQTNKQLLYSAINTASTVRYGLFNNNAVLAFSSTNCGRISINTRRRMKSRIGIKKYYSTYHVDNTNNNNNSLLKMITIINSINNDHDKYNDTTTTTTTTTTTVQTIHKNSSNGTKTNYNNVLFKSIFDPTIVRANTILSLNNINDNTNIDNRIDNTNQGTTTTTTTTTTDIKEKEQVTILTNSSSLPHSTSSLISSLLGNTIVRATNTIQYDNSEYIVPDTQSDDSIGVENSTTSRSVFDTINTIIDTVSIDSYLNISSNTNNSPQTKQQIMNESSTEEEGKQQQEQQKVTQLSTKSLERSRKILQMKNRMSTSTTTTTTTTLLPSINQSRYYSTGSTGSTAKSTTLMNSSDNEIEKSIMDDNEKYVQDNYGTNPTITVTALAHLLWKSIHIRPGIDCIIDATAGNGYDSIQLAKLLFRNQDQQQQQQQQLLLSNSNDENENNDTATSSNVQEQPINNSRLICIDIQKEACDNTEKALRKILSNNIMKNNVQIINDSHSPLPTTSRNGKNDSNNNIVLIVYNLGYLPDNRKSLVVKQPYMTISQTTLSSIVDASLTIRIGGMISIITYPRSNPQEDIIVRTFLEGLAMFSTTIPIPIDNNNDDEDLSSSSIPLWEKYMKQKISTLMTTASGTVPESVNDELKQQLLLSLQHVYDIGGSKQTWRVHEHKKIGWIDAPILITATKIK